MLSIGRGCWTRLCWAGECDTYEYNVHAAPLPTFGLVKSHGKSTARHVRVFVADLTKGRGNAVVDGTRMEAQRRTERVSGR